MKDIRENAKEILMKQLELLHEESKKNNLPEELADLSTAMAQVSTSIAILDNA